ncbi:MAG: hypothetical protein IH892_07340 [Planctomycetes bacterium]|nr:hypothetical protein [Planctomycetota bacterium]
MTDLFFQMALSNACLALALAIVAMVVGVSAKRPHVATFGPSALAARFWHTW